MAKGSMIPHVLNAMGNTKVAKDGRKGFKLSAGFKLDAKKLEDGRHKNLRVVFKNNFQMNSDLFIHAILNQVIGTDAISQITKEAQAKDALTLKKRSNSDEFLVEKKSPLVLPPSYGELPIPSEVKEIDEKKNDNNNDIQATLKKNKLINNKTIKNSKPTSIEESVLKKIK